jgi:hypothetical protein
MYRLIFPNGGKPIMSYHPYKSDYERMESVIHAEKCKMDECEYCRSLCDSGAIISCDGCGFIHHTDWLGWTGEVNNKGQCSVFCPECC